MDTASPLFLALDLLGVFAFALNGALTAIRVARIDLVGVITLGMITALGGGIIRDTLLASLPPATFDDWRYLAVAAAGSFVAYLFGRSLERLAGPILVLDAAGLSLFAVAGALKAVELGAGFGQAVILGVVTGVGGGTLRDVMLGRIPFILHEELYAIPALIAALLFVSGIELDLPELPTAVVAAAVCFGVRMLGIRYNIGAPVPPDIDPRRLMTWREARRDRPVTGEPDEL